MNGHTSFSPCPSGFTPWASPPKQNLPYLKLIQLGLLNIQFIGNKALLLTWLFVKHQWQIDFLCHTETLHIHPNGFCHFAVGYACRWVLELLTNNHSCSPAYYSWCKTIILSTCCMVYVQIGFTPYKCIAVYTYLQHPASVTVSENVSLDPRCRDRGSSDNPKFIVKKGTQKISSVQGEDRSG